VHFSSAQDMMNGQVSSPIDRMAIKKLNGYKIDRGLKEVKRIHDVFS